MVEPELAAVIVLSRTPLLQQDASTRVVQLAVVENDQTWKARRVRPRVVVTGGVAELIDDQIVGMLAVLPEEVVRAEQARAFDRRTDALGLSVDEQIDLVGRRETWEDLPVVPGDAGFSRSEQ
jgi:hypothetical protein